MTLAVTIVPVTQYQQNCSIVKCQATGKAAIVDPGGDIDCDTGLDWNGRCPRCGAHYVILSAHPSGPAR